MTRPLRPLATLGLRLGATSPGVGGEPADASLLADEGRLGVPVMLPRQAVGLLVFEHPRFSAL